MKITKLKNIITRTYNKMKQLKFKMKGRIIMNSKEDIKYVKNNFWKKTKKVMGKVPFISDVISLYFCAIDQRTPLNVRLSAFSALAYFVSPVDFIADILPGGFVDDAGVISSAMLALNSYITNEHRRKAEDWLNSNKSKNI